MAGWAEEALEETHEKKWGSNRWRIGGKFQDTVLCMGRGLWWEEHIWFFVGFFVCIYVCWMGVGVGRSGHWMEGTFALPWMKGVTEETCIIAGQVPHGLDVSSVWNHHHHHLRPKRDLLSHRFPTLYTLVSVCYSTRTEQSSELIFQIKISSLPHRHPSSCPHFIKEKPSVSASILRARMKVRLVIANGIVLFWMNSETMTRDHQSTEGLSVDLDALVAWVQSMPRSALSSPEHQRTAEARCWIQRLKEQFAQLNAQVKMLTSVVNELQATVGRLDLDWGISLLDLSSTQTNKNYFALPQAGPKRKKTLVSRAMKISPQNWQCHYSQPMSATHQVWFLNVFYFQLRSRLTLS